MTEFFPPVAEASVVSQDERQQSCSLRIIDALRQNFSLLVQTQRTYDVNVREDAEFHPELEPVFVVPEDTIESDLLDQIVSSPMLPRFLVPQDEA